MNLRPEKRELVAMLMESPLYFELLVWERLELLRDHVRRLSARPPGEEWPRGSMRFDQTPPCTSPSRSDLATSGFYRPPSPGLKGPWLKAVITGSLE